MACVWSKNQLLTQSNASLSDSPLRSSSHVGLPLWGIKTAKSSSRSEFCGQSIVYPNKYSQRNQQAPPVKVGLSIGKAMKWWEKGIQPNMKEICSAQDLVDSLLDAGNTLVIVDFFSPGCGGCRALHPKICQIAEQNPEVQFLQINYEEHKSMCYSLNVHVLPFFRFYRGAQGRLCSFSCTNATIKKFKDALAKHTTERCSLGSARGLEETELLALAENKDLLFNYIKKSDPFPVHACSTPTDNLSSNPRTIIQEAEEKSLVIF